MKTRDKIISKAVALYNENGLTHVSSRHIAAALNMSHGNLEYHFPNKEAILLEIYRLMRGEISAFYQPEGMEDPMLHFERLLEALVRFQEKYSFFNLDVLEISRKHQQVNRLLQETFRTRKEQMANIFEQLQREAYLKSEAFPGQYVSLQLSLRIIITFWKPQEAVLPSPSPGYATDMRTHLWHLLLPHFTARGLAAYERMQAFQTG